MSMFDDIKKLNEKRSRENKQAEPVKTRLFPSPYVDINLLKSYLNGNGDIEKLANENYLSPGQVSERINATARAIVSAHNEDVDPNILKNIYGHRLFFLREIDDYLYIKNYENPDYTDQKFLDVFSTYSERKRVLLMEQMEELHYKLMQASNVG